MTQLTSPFLDAKYGWEYGENGWNSGMDENLLKFSFMFDRNVNSITNTLPSAVSGQAHFLTTDNRLYFAVGTTYYSCIVPLWFVFQLESTGEQYQFNGTAVQLIPSQDDLGGRLDAVEVTIGSLGTAAYENIAFFATTAQLDVASSVSAAYTDALKSDLANSSDVSKGAAKIGYKGRSLSTKLNDFVVVTDFGPVDTAANTLTTFTAALAEADSTNKALIVPAGVYSFTSIPNFAKTNRHMYAIGRVVLKSTGATAWAMDLTAGASNFYNFRMIGDWVVEGNVGNTGGVHIQGLHHSIIQLRAMNIPGRAFQVNYGVLTKYRLTASINVGPGSEWTIVPTLGLYLDQRNVGEFISACWFDMRIEGINGVGVDIISCQQSSFTGTSEANANIGIRTGVGSRYNSFNNVDIEQNLANDVWAGGYSDIWNNITCRSTSVTNNIEVVSGAEGNQFIGGDLRCANMNSGSFTTHFSGCRFSDNASLGLKGTGGYTHKNCVRYNVSGVVTSRYTTKLGTEGTFNVLIAGATTAGVHTYSTGSAGVGFFKVSGGYVEGEVFATMTVKDAAMAGNVLITGFPYTSDSTANRFSSGQIGVWGNVSLPSAGYTGLSWRMAPASSTMTVLATGYGNAVASVAAGSITATTTLSFSFRYPLPTQM